jgi:hypothetical protein
MGKGSIDPDSPAALAKSAIGREERRSLIAVDPDRALRIGGCHGKRHSALADRHSNSDHQPVAAVPGLTTADGRQMNKWLFQASEFLSAPLGFYALLLAMAVVRRWFRSVGRTWFAGPAAPSAPLVKRLLA